MGYGLFVLGEFEQLCMYAGIWEDSEHAQVPI